jgi:hypothetical protein
VATGSNPYYLSGPAIRGSPGLNLQVSGHFRPLRFGRADRI